MKSTERRLKLLLLLQSGSSQLNANDIAERFNVSRRTVFRDLRFLENIDVPVTWDENRGYHIVRGYKIPPLMFTQKELATVLVGLSFVKSQVDGHLAEDAQGVELKIQNVLPPDLKEFMSTLEDRLMVAPYMNFGIEKKKGGNWYEISRAITQNRRIMFRYESRKDDILTLRKLDPYLLVFFQDHWNLIGHSHKRKELRNFLLDRISNVRITDESFELSDNFDPRKIIFHRNENTQPIKVAVQPESVDRFKTYLPAPLEEEAENDEGRHILQFHFNNLDYLNRWLLQFANNIEVIGPSSLQKKREKLLKRMLNT